MNEINLSSKELLVLSSFLGADNFFGIKDPFRGMTRDEIRAEIPSIQLQAEKNGLASLGFDNSFIISSEADRIISACAMCDMYLSIDVIDCGIQQAREMFYSRGFTTVSLKCIGENATLLEESNQEVAKKLMATLFAPCSEVLPTKQESIYIHQSILAQAYTEPENQMVQKLMDEGCSSEMATAIASGLQRKCKYCSLLAVNLTNRAVKNLICIISPQGTIRLHPADMEDMDIWLAHWITKSQIEGILSDMLGEFGAHDGGEANAGM